MYRFRSTLKNLYIYTELRSFFVLVLVWTVNTIFLTAVSEIKGSQLCLAATVFLFIYFLG